MRILFLSDDFPPLAPGGASVIAFRLAKGLLRRGHQVFVLTTVRDRNLAGKTEYEGLKYFRIYSSYHERWRAYLSLYNPQAAGQIENVIRNVKPDVVHAFNVHYHLSYHSLGIAKKYSPAVFLTICDTMPFSYGKFDSFIGYGSYRMGLWDLIGQAKKRYNPLRNLVIRHYLRCPDKIFSLSAALKEAMEANRIGNIDVVYSGIDLADWDVQQSCVESFKREFGLSGRKVVFFGGRLSEPKGGEKIILAMNRVVGEIPEAVLLIAGRKDDYAQKMILLARQLRMENNLVFTGWLDKEDMKLAYHNCDLAVFPSIYLDAFGLINLEAMAARKPMVSTCFGGASEIVVDNKTGFVVNPFNVEVLKDKILDLLMNRRRAEEFGKAGYQRVKKLFSLERQVDETLKYYENIICLP